MLVALEGHVDMILEEGYKQETMDIVYGAYGFMTAAYASVDFAELEDHKSEPAVVQLFETRELLPQLGKAIHEFGKEAIAAAYSETALTEEMSSYRTIQETLAKIRLLDKGNNYHMRLEALIAGRTNT